MNEKLSKALFAFSVLLCVVACGLSILWLRIVTNRNGFEAMGFLFFIAPVFCGCALFLGIVPAQFLLRRHNGDRERKSLRLSWSALGLIAAETSILLLIPVSGC
jgi:hypothetical protein